MSEAMNWDNVSVRKIYEDHLFTREVSRSIGSPSFCVLQVSLWFLVCSCLSWCWNANVHSHLFVCVCVCVNYSPALSLSFSVVPPLCHDCQCFQSFCWMKGCSDPHEGQEIVLRTKLQPLWHISVAGSMLHGLNERAQQYPAWHKPCLKVIACTCLEYMRVGPHLHAIIW